jgi:hypothetical protein
MPFGWFRKFGHADNESAEQLQLQWSKPTLAATKGKHSRIDRLLKER